MKKICIIKLGADGDVLRTLPLAKALQHKHQDAQITWITRGDIGTLFSNLPYIYAVKTLPYTEGEEFDSLYNFDVEADALRLAEEIKAKEKFGFYGEGEYPAARTMGGEYYLNTMFDDELKKSNTKTYQEMMFMAAELPYSKENYKFILEEKDRNYAEKFMQEHAVPQKNLIGIHMGASSRWPSKVWDSANMIKFITIAKNKGYAIMIFGGPNEAKAHADLAKKLQKQGIAIYHNNPANTKREFASLVDRCDAMICSDSLSLHVSLGLCKKTIGLFFCTSADEVEGYDALTKLVSPLQKSFFPEKMNMYDTALTQSISAEEVLNAVEKALGANKNK